MPWKFLSYELSEKLSGYGGGETIKIEKSRQMCCGDTSNNTEFWMPTHFGTHIDYPFHFSVDGKTGSDYAADKFIFDEISIQELDLRNRESKMITPEDIISSNSRDAEILILKTFYSDLRDEKIYWENGPGFMPETAKRLKEVMPNLKAIAFDSISLTNFQHRPLGRVAHKSFLMEEDILIIEDVDLREVSKNTKVSQLIISPLRMPNADGAPVTIFAKVEND